MGVLPQIELKEKQILTVPQTTVNKDAAHDRPYAD
jgi:hypothetical protein